MVASKSKPDLKIFRELCDHYTTVRRSAEALGKQVEHMKERLRETVRGAGKPRPDGGRTIEVPGYRADLVNATSYSVDDDAAEKFFEDHPELRKKARSWSYDREKIEALWAAGEIDDADYHRIIQPKVTERFTLREQKGLES